MPHGRSSITHPRTLALAIALTSVAPLLAQTDAQSDAPSDPQTDAPERRGSGVSAPTYTLDATSGWRRGPGERGAAPEPGSEEARLLEIRRLLADDQANAALRRLDAFIERAESEGSRYLDEALLLRGDAKVARDEEFEALYDYERLIRTYPQSEHFVTAVDRETRIANLYLDGLKLRIFGLRLIDGEDIAIELLIRAQERLPGSSIAEDASIRIADYYYAKREMRLARDAYELYLVNYPQGPRRIHAERRLIYADMARFKGPRYDGSALQDVRLRIRDFAERYPAEAAASGINEGLVARIDESTAAQLLIAAEWYLGQDRDASARYTLRRLLRAHPDTIAAQRAREIMDDNAWLIPQPPPRDKTPAEIEIEGALRGEAEPIDDNQDDPQPEDDDR